MGKSKLRNKTSEYSSKDWQIVCIYQAKWHVSGAYQKYSLFGWTTNDWNCK